MRMLKAKNLDENVENTSRTNGKKKKKKKRNRTVLNKPKAFRNISISLETTKQDKEHVIIYPAIKHVIMVPISLSQKQEIISWS